MTETRRGRRPGVVAHVWTEAEDDLLGRYTDAVVAEIVGVHRRVAESRRVRLGVAARSREPYPLDTTLAWYAEQDGGAP